MRTLKLTIVIVLALRASAAQAQACLGLPSFGNASVHVNIAGEFPDSATAYALGVGGGRDNQVFGNVGAGQTTYEGLDEKSTFGFLELGYQIPLRARVQVCPIISAYMGAGPDDEEIQLTVRSRGAAAGVAAGMPVRARWLTLIPNVAVRYAFDEFDIVEEGIGSLTERFDGGTVDLGMGAVFNDRISIQPLLHIPFAGDAGEVSFGAFAAVRFGWRDW